MRFWFEQHNYKACVKKFILVRIENGTEENILYVF